MELKSCAITGHRPTRFRFKYQEDDADCRRLKECLREQFILLYEQGISHFWVGGAEGVDMWSGEVLLQMKETQYYHDVELHLALPGPKHDSKWGKPNRERMTALIEHSSETVMVGTGLTAGDYRKRNQYIVDHANILLAVYDNNRSIRSGTGMTVNYARKKGLPIILIHPDTAVVQFSSQ